MLEKAFDRSFDEVELIRMILPAGEKLDMDSLLPEEITLLEDLDIAEDVLTTTASQLRGFGTSPRGEMERRRQSKGEQNI